MRLFASIFVFLFAALAAQPSQAAVDVQIDLSTQTMQVSSSSGESYQWPVSTARSGYVTPRGVYRSQRLEKMHYSRKYDNAPMPHSIFFRGGYAIHATYAVRSLGRPASHGCVRLSPANAAKLYAMVQREGARISIYGAPPRAAVASRAGKTHVAKARHGKSRMAKSERRHYAKSAHRRYVEAAHRHRYASRGVAVRYGAAPVQRRALGYAPAPRQPSLMQWLRAPAW